MTTDVDITKEDALALVEEYFRLEGAGEIDQQQRMVVPDFIAVGPLGFILPHDEWARSRKSGDFAYRSFKWSDAEARIYGDAAVVIGIQESEATYQGHRADGRFRATVIVVNQDRQRRVASAHFSSIAAPPDH